MMNTRGRRHASKRPPDPVEAGADRRVAPTTSRLWGRQDPLYCRPMNSEPPRLILVVEDDDDVREFAVDVLRDKGYHVIEAVNGGVALGLLQQDLPIDLLFTDTAISGRSAGVALAGLAKELRTN